MVMRVCAHGGCRTLVESGRCERHRRQQNRESSKNRPGDPFYSSRPWIQIRDARRSANPLCQECEKQGLVVPMWAVDHIKPRCDYPELALEYENTQSLCERCHNTKTAKERSWAKRIND